MNRLRHCSSCGSTDIVNTAYGFECCRCGAEYDIDREDERVRDALNDILEELSGANDDEGKVAILGNVIRTAESMRRRLEGL